jgi:dephospho-CoA kinase
MISIGITGSYASGKSYLLNLLSEQGFETFSCDKYVGELYQQPTIQSQILKLIPDMAGFDIRKLAEKIYADDNIRKKIEALIHPLVLAHILKFKENCTHKNFVFIEVPLLFEAGWESHFNYIVTAFCSSESRLKHAMSKNNFDKNIYDKLEQIQFPQDEKMKRADFVINMDVKMLELKTQISNILEKIQ